MSSSSLSADSKDNQYASTSQRERKAHPSQTKNRKGEKAKERQKEKQQIKFNERTYQSVKQNLATASIRLIGISDRAEIEVMQRQFDEWDKLLAEGKPITFPGTDKGQVVVSNNEVDVGLDMSEITHAPEECELDSRESVKSVSEITSDTLHEMPLLATSQSIPCDAVSEKELIEIPIDSVVSIQSSPVPSDKVIDPMDELSVQVDDSMDVSVDVTPSEPCETIYRLTNGKGFSNCASTSVSSPAKKARASGRRFSITSVSEIRGRKYSITYNLTCQHLYATHIGTGVHVIRQMDGKYLHRVRPKELLVWIDDG